MINRKIDIYEPDEIKAVFDFICTEFDVISISEYLGVSTIESNSLILLNDVQKIYLKAGQIVTINATNYTVLAVDLAAKTFNISAMNLTATKWNLAVNFKFGSRIEINELLNI
jgi:hypothetical protein